MKCKGHQHIPCTNWETGHVFWREVPCDSEASPGRLYCAMHDDLSVSEKPPAFVNQVLGNKADIATCPARGAGGTNEGKEP